MLGDTNMYKNIVKLRKNIESIVGNFHVYEDRNKENLIDFVLTYTIDDSDDIIKQRIRNEYLQNLRKTGLLIRTAPSLLHPDTIFVLIYGTKKLLTFFASYYGIQLSCENPYYVKERHRGLLAFSCKVNFITTDDPEFEMAPDTFSGERPREITNCERIMVIYQILRNTQYGVLPTQHGILRLLEKNIFTKAYPLHEYHNVWSGGGYLTDRELLIRYWANPKCFFKRQPLNLIEKYFGSEVGFYYAFLSHYISCMLYASIIGGCTFMYGVFTLRSQENIRSFQICESNVTICPKCPNFDVCKYVKLHNSCAHAYLTHILDNKGTVWYAVVISLWTTIYFELWKRRQAGLAYEWNVLSSHIDVSVRYEVIQKLYSS